MRVIQQFVFIRLFVLFAGLMMCVLITACNLGVIGALFKMKRRSETRSLKKRKLNCFDQSINGKQEESMGLRNDVAKAKVSVDRSNSTMTTASSRPSFRKREGSLAQNHAKEEVKFAILMVLSFFYILKTKLTLIKNHDVLFKIKSKLN